MLAVAAELLALTLFTVEEEDALVLESIDVEKEDALDGVVVGKAGGTYAEGISSFASMSIRISASCKIKNIIFFI